MSEFVHISRRNNNGLYSAYSSDQMAVQEAFSEFYKKHWEWDKYTVTRIDELEHDYVYEVRIS